MVTSGLFERTEVSPARLAVHMGTALIIWRWGSGALGRRSPRRRGLARSAGRRGADGAGFRKRCLARCWPDRAEAQRRLAAHRRRWIPPARSGLPLLANFTEDRHPASAASHARLCDGAWRAWAFCWRRCWRDGAARAGRGLSALALAQAAGDAAVLLGSPLWISLVHQGGAVAFDRGACQLAGGVAVRIAVIRRKIIPYMQRIEKYDKYSLLTPSGAQLSPPSLFANTTCALHRRARRRLRDHARLGRD